MLVSVLFVAFEAIILIKTMKYKQEVSMKKLSTVFAALAILLTNIMCVMVTYNCPVLRYTPGNSAPWSVGILLAIPFVIGIIACFVVSYIAKKKSE